MLELRLSSIAREQRYLHTAAFSLMLLCLWACVLVWRVPGEGNIFLEGAGEVVDLSGRPPVPLEQSLALL